MSKILIESKAYTKIMLHLIKYTSNDCYGLLLGNNNKVNDKYNLQRAMGVGDKNHIARKGPKIVNIKK